jgi:hypothetical protein
MHGIFLYVDPGSGSYLVQVIVAGAAFYFKSGWNYLKSLFRKHKKEE